MNGINIIKRKYSYILIYAALFPILWFRSFTPANELRYLEIADEALKSGSFFSFSYHGIPYADKPPLYLWIVMLCKWVFGGHYMGILTLFSIIPAFIIAYIMYKWSQSELSEDTKHVGDLMLLTCGLFLGAGIVVRMDMLMTLFIVLALRCFYDIAVNRNNSIKQQILFPIYLFLAVFCKGPLGIAIPLVATLSFLIISRKISSFFKYWNWKTFSILLIGCSIWFFVVYVEGGGNYLYNLLFHQTFGRAYHSFHHSRPFYYYLQAASYSFLPWTLLIITTHIKGIWEKGMSDLQKFYLCVSVPTLLLLSVISSKLAVYMLPMCPFLIYFSAIQLSKSKWNLWYAISIAIPAVALFFSIPALIVLIGHMDSLNCWPFYFMAAILTVTGIYAFHLILHRQLINAIRILTLGLFIGIFIGGFGIEKINYLI